MKHSGLAVLPLLVLPALAAGQPDPVLRHVKVYAEPGRFGGWPANHGIWSWGDEILVGFSAGYHKDLGPDRHAIDRERPEEHLLARSRDGGETWSIENPAAKGALIPVGAALHGLTPAGLEEKPWRDCPGGIDFTHPDFALTARMTGTASGPSRFYYSYDRGATWDGPFRLPLFGRQGIAARTDYIAGGKHDCTLFLTASKDDGREGRPFCARTTDGGRTWNFLSWMTSEPAGYAIMPSTVRLSETELLSAVRCREGSRSWISAYRSLDNGASWAFDRTLVPDTGEGNPPSLIRLASGSLCLTYGRRAPPFGIHARVSQDGGGKWSQPITLRGGAGRDLGYPRSVQRPDGKVVTVYYIHDTPEGERYIAASIWEPRLVDALLGHWRLEEDCRDASANALHGTNHGVRFAAVDEGADAPAAGRFDGRGSWIEVPPSPALELGEKDFTIAVWAHPAGDGGEDDAYGDILSRYDPVNRRGLMLSITHNTGVTASQANTRNLHFGIDDGRIEPRWSDHGRPGNAVLVFALAAFDGGLYAGTCEPGRDESGRVYRLGGEARWFDCGSPARCNSVSALAVFGGRLYAGVSKYRLAGSALPESENPHSGGGVYRYQGEQAWEDCGRLPGAEAVGGLVVYRGRLYASSLYQPAGFFRYEGEKQWTALETPGGKRVEALCIFNGQIFASSYDEGRVYRYAGSSWTDCGQLGTSANTQTYAFAIHEGRLYAGAWRTGKVFCYRADADWEDMGRLGEELEVMGMLVHNGKLYAGTLPHAEVYRFDSQGSWTQVGRLDHTPDAVYRRAWTMAEFQGRLFCGTLPSGRVLSIAAGRSVSWNRELPAGWRHIAATRQGGRLRLYLDGRAVVDSLECDAGEIDLASTQPLKIGFGPNDYFRGGLRDLRIYGSALSDREIGGLAARAPGR
jgi:hypothetical protein